MLVKRGDIEFDFETRPTEEFVFAGDEPVLDSNGLQQTDKFGKLLTTKRKSYVLKDTICGLTVRKYKSTIQEKMLFTTNQNKSSARQFLDWLIQEAHAQRYYNIVAWNGSRFDFYLNIDSEMLKYIFKYSGLKSFDVIDGYVSDEFVYGRYIFGTYVDTLYEEKARQDELKASHDPIYNLAYREVIKLYLNSLSGKLVEDPNRYSKLEFMSKSTDTTELSLGGVEVIKVKDNDKMNDWLITGVMVYLYSKRLLFEYIQCLPNASDDVINVETNSMYFDGRVLDIFENNVKNYKGDYPVAIGSALGNMNKEYDTMDVSYFLGKKMYYLAGKFVIKGIPLTTIDNSGKTIELINEEMYERLFNGGSLVKKFMTLKKSLFGNTYISCHEMTRTINPMYTYKTYE